MRKRLIILIVLLTLAGVGGLLTWVSGAFEPRYDGVPASQYFLNLMGRTSFGGVGDREKVRRVPATVGVPILIRLTEAQDSRWRGWYQRLYPRLPRFISRRIGPPKSNATIVVRAVMALGYYGPAAREAVPQLLKLNGGATSGVLGQLLSQPLLTTLGEIGPDASNAVPALMLQLQTGSTYIASMAVTALGRIDHRGERSGAMLVSLLHRPVLQLSALQALSRMASNDTRWIPDIWRAIEISSHPEMISQGAHQLHGLRALDATRVQALVARGSSDEPMVRAGVASALFYPTDHAGMTLPLVLKLVAETNTFIRANATRTLLHYGQATDIDLALRLAALEPALEFGDTSGRWTALETVLTLKTNAAPLIRPTIALLSDKNERVRAKAAEAVGSLGPAAREAEPMLRSLLEDEWAYVRESAEGALKEIKSRSPQ
jgi:hypothetical protein